MLMVIAVLAVLMGIVATAATSVIRKSRERKNEALRVALQTGIATFYQQNGYWPPSSSGQLQTWAEKGISSALGREWSNGVNITNLDPKEYDELMMFFVKECLNSTKNPYMDASGFTAVRASAASASDYKKELSPCFGEEVRSWVAKQRAGSAPKSGEMTFGYSNSAKGHFRRFIIYYNTDSDSVTVGYSKKSIGARGKDKKLKYETNYSGDDDK